MRRFTLNDLRWLVDRQEPPCVSIFLDLRRSTRRAGEPRIRLERLLRQAARLLGTESPRIDVRSLLQGARTVAAGLGPRSASLAVFRSPDVLVRYLIPAAIPDLVVVATTFHTRPLVAYLNGERRFFLLRLRAGPARLQEGTPAGLFDVDGRAVPEPLRSALAARRDHGAGQDGLSTYFRAIDKALASFLEDDRAPLILAGTPSLQRAYRAVSTCPELLDQGIAADTGRASSRAVHGRAMALVDEQAALVESELLAQIGSARGPATFDLVEIARAAVRGDVRVFVHALEAEVWGHLDRATGAIAVHDRQRDAADAELLDDIAEVVLLGGGDVFAVRGDRIPGGHPAAALYRS